MGKEGRCLAVNGDRSANLLAVGPLPGGFLVEVLFSLI